MLIRTTRQLRMAEVGMHIKFEKAILCYVRGEKCFEQVEGSVAKIGKTITVVNSFGHIYEVPVPKSAQTNDFN